MSCCGHHRARIAIGAPDFPRGDERFRAPTEPCVFCAEKHYSTAMRLAQECGYEAPNRQFIIGELCACQWHLHRHNEVLAEQVRGIRHLIQLRREEEIDWIPVAKEIDALATKEAQEIKTDPKT